MNENSETNIQKNESIEEVVEVKKEPKTTSQSDIKDNHGASTSAVVGSVFFLLGIAVIFVLALCLFLYLVTK